MEGLQGVSRPVSSIGIDRLKATARRTREGGVKSPGRPNMPDPWPKPGRVTDPILAGGILLTVSFVSLFRRVLCQSWVGEFVITPRGGVKDLDLATDDFDCDAGPRRFAQHVMHFGRDLPLRQHARRNDDVLQPGADFGDSGKVFQHPGAKFPGATVLDASSTVHSM